MLLRFGYSAAMRSSFPFFLLASTLCFALGIALPLLHVERLYFFADEPSLLSMVGSLWKTGDWTLAILIALFSIAFPVLKLALLHNAAYALAGEQATVPTWIRALSNWSMLDVVLVALVVFAAKTSGLATAFTKPGLWFFAASILLTALASALLKRPAVP